MGTSRLIQIHFGVKRTSPVQGMCMNDEETQSVEEPQVEAQEATAQAPESEKVQDQRQESPEDRKKRNDLEYNWAESRRIMEEQKRQIREQNDYISKLTKPTQPQEDDELDKLADDDIITKAHAKKLASKMAKEIANQVIKEREASTVEERIKNKFPDFDQIVTHENIELLKKQEPELAESLSFNPDPYKQAILVYKELKKIGVGEMKAPIEKEKAIKNSAKPLSVNSVTKQSAIGNAHLFENGLTPELKKQLLNEMREASKRA
jgi:hypothetical protein